MSDMACEKVFLTLFQWREFTPSFLGFFILVGICNKYPNSLYSVIDTVNCLIWLHIMQRFLSQSDFDLQVRSTISFRSRSPTWPLREFIACIVSMQITLGPVVLSSNFCIDTSIDRSISQCSYIFLIATRKLHSSVSNPASFNSNQGSHCRDLSFRVWKVQHEQQKMATSLVSFTRKREIRKCSWHSNQTEQINKGWSTFLGQPCHFQDLVHGRRPSR